MPTDLDIYRPAKLLIDQHGQDAAARRADALRDTGDLDGQRFFNATMARLIIVLERINGRDETEAAYGDDSAA